MEFVLSLHQILNGHPTEQIDSFLLKRKRKKREQINMQIVDDILHLQITPSKIFFFLR